MIARNTVAEIVEHRASTRTFLLSARAIETTVRCLREEGEYRVESLVFWLGALDGNVGTITSIVVPRGPGVFKHPLQVRVDENVIAALCGLVDPPRSIVLGQVHTHLAEAFHSPSDDKYSLDTVGFLSVVIPHFARGTSSQLRKWAFYECISSQRFRKIAGDELNRRLIALDDNELSVQTVYG